MPRKPKPRKKGYEDKSNKNFLSRVIGVQFKDTLTKVATKVSNNFYSSNVGGYNKVDHPTTDLNEISTTNVAGLKINVDTGYAIKRQLSDNTINPCIRITMSAPSSQIDVGFNPYLFIHEKARRN